MTEAYVNLHIENEVGYIEFFHPAHNSLPGNILAKLAQTITDAGNNTEIKVIVLKSGGDRTFCAGASFNELINIDDPATGKVFFSGFANVINAMRKCPKFIIGRIQGKTVGGGVGLAASTDYCMATKFAAIKLSELNIGIGPFVVGPAIERKMGLSAMSQIAIDANTFYPAEWAKQKGLFTHVYDSTEELDEAVKATAEHLCTYNTEAMLEMKKIFWKGTDDWDDLLAERAQTSGRLVLSDFTKEKLKSFK
ncbi:enoyl-CoA hydratase/isomerase family protein [Psychroserpens sp.]|uniref:enoyl-CoA hydratase/isomerase family protein n=1 Tax=Psychroserpens sp. TaxID=2020870 RepID=UPI001B0744C5|nr:enoyl-CoA hydratase/isomerase family protein [Psychroserpens sp.]MBO6607978.1 enoyl-CoA hydratase/isomerase family protein [Psychroserpens sp.]MBO6631563.1 enoyl-CoA hydratase/isomerase family protein [Psychroserpens sp.]MBO6654895.1 enoyl-CoA hydratase/isomerase family protein [Psychroserpens sp.]MBO6683031.1 enoyl-CoA hydratase/isomerase family protein [Psychroserpens sp.]MBO6751336.1 enoyl-CoA hydratase/isomerase family protein [Psychroserpens sp.]